MLARYFSYKRFFAILIKEFIQIKRDHATFAMMFFLPLIQLLLFGYAINFDPRGLPTAVVATKETPYTRSILGSLQQSTYFRFTHSQVSEQAAEQLMRTGKVQFIISIPSDFSTQLIHQQKPQILIQSDNTDPATTTPALSVINSISGSVLQNDLTGPLAFLKEPPPPFEVVVHNRYNPEAITQYNIVPGLTGIILTMTMVMVASMTMTREFERGTLENLMILPVKPIEVMFGKIIPFVCIGCIQVSIILLAAHFLFSVPILGSAVLLYLITLLFILTNLAVGFTFSTLADKQVQASQMATFFFLPSFILSGFAFPFRGMPQWAQTIGEMLPLTHYLRIIRGILLKGNSLVEIWPNLWPLLLFMLAATFIALRRYRLTLD
jgi:ABC-2 type transport system permease protein